MAEISLRHVWDGLLCGTAEGFGKSIASVQCLPSLTLTNDPCAASAAYKGCLSVSRLRAFFCESSSVVSGSGFKRVLSSMRGSPDGLLHELVVRVEATVAQPACQRVSIR